MATIKEVVLLFAELTDDEKAKCLRTLEYRAKPSNIISNFSLKHQFVYKENIVFKRTPPRKGDTEVEITLITSFGKYAGKGKSLEQAKIHAIQLAEWSEIEEVLETGDSLKNY